MKYSVFLFLGLTAVEPSKSMASQPNTAAEAQELEHGERLDEGEVRLKSRDAERDLKGAVQDIKRESRDNRRRIDRVDQKIKRMERRDRFR